MTGAGETAMTSPRQSYVEHVAVRVKDIDWHIRFLRDALGMPLRQVEGAADAPRQVWTVAGMQLIADPAFDGPEGRLAHLGVMTEDLEAALGEVYRWGVKALPQGRNWIALPDGLCVELMQASRGAVGRVLAIDPRA
jgi:catechol 2,3-dioxygenase-like lactoylglutathione lyase family enzyme